MATRKVLISGPVDGKLSTLFKRVSAVNAKSGPFDVLLCLGPFFPPAGDDAGELDPELEAYISGATPIPLPTYFLGAWGGGAGVALGRLLAGSNERLRYLGRSGVRDVQGLVVAFLDGTFSADAFRSTLDAEEGTTCRHYNKVDVARLKQSLASAEGDIDVLLTCEWPDSVTLGCAPGSLPQGLNPTGSATAAEIAEAARPRYHFAGGKGVFFSRAPYYNRDLGAGPLATRFIALAEVGGPRKEKALHALQLTPAANMDAAQLVAVPEGSTPSPYEAVAASRKRAAEQAARDREDDLGNQNWRWRQQKRQKPASDNKLRNRDVIIDNRRSVLVRNIALRAEDADIVAFFERAGKVVDIRRGTNAEGRPNPWGYVQFDSDEAAERAAQLSGTELCSRAVEITTAERAAEAGGKMGKPVANCWFCLSNEAADTELVVSVGEECYCAMDKGALHATHVLLLPVEHYPSTISLSRATWAEMERYLSALRSAYASQGRELVAFERHVALKRIGGNHCHVNCVGVPLSAAAGAREMFESHASTAGFAFQHISAGAGESLRSMVRDAVGDGEFFQALLPGGERLVHPIRRGERHPLNFGREVLAALLGTLERADWKNCVSSVEQEQEQAAAFKAFFKPFDPMQGLQAG